MTIAQVYSGWGIGDKLTSAQMNALDVNVTNALDRRAGQTDTLASVVSLSGAGRIVEKYAAGADADTTYLVSGANSIIDVSTLTADRAYTLGNTNAVAGDRLFVLNRHATKYITVKDNAAATLIVLGPAIQGNGESSWAEFVFTSAWILMRSAARPTLDATTVTASGAFTYVVPRGCTLLLAIACGGGAGGGAGSQPTTAASVYNAGGGGGGGALMRAVFVPGVTPGASLAGNLGAGGAGGASAAAAGTDGTDTTFNGLIWPGAGAGKGSNTTGNGSLFTFPQGGKTARGTGNVDDLGANTNIAAPVCIKEPGRGGYGSMRPAVSANFQGANSEEGFAGGAVGGIGTDSGTYNGGSGGGGGGAGPFGAGAVGGNGGNGNNAGTGTAATAGANAAANSGAGGGGGGGGGFGSVATGTFGTGGAGGSGKFIIVPLR